jgi:UDP-N-acetyl-D-glucosamine dehydrogenase
MKVSIIGQGYVGLTISAFAARHHQVVGFDIDLKTVTQLNKGISHIEGISSEELTDSINRNMYKATADPKDISDSDIVIIAVPTPLDKNRKPDMSYIDTACKVIGENLNNSALIINESTSFPGTIRNYIKPAIEKY